MSQSTDQPEGCGAHGRIPAETATKASRVRITYYCSNCGTDGSITVRWSSHHALPIGWGCRDTDPTYELPRRSDHIFHCPDLACKESLDKKYPPPKEIVWFASS